MKKADSNGSTLRNQTRIIEEPKCFYFSLPQFRFKILGNKKSLDYPICQQLSVDRSCIWTSKYLHYIICEISKFI